MYIDTIARTKEYAHQISFSCIFIDNELSGKTTEDADIEDDTDTLTIPPAEEGAEESYTELEGEFTGTVKTDYGETEGPFSNMTWAMAASTKQLLLASLQEQPCISFLLLTINFSN